MSALALAGLLHTGAVAALTLTGFDVRGIADPELSENVRARLGALRAEVGVSITEARLSYLLRNAPEEVRKALEPFGYYEPQVEVTPQRSGETATIVIDVTPGPAIKVERHQIVLEGEGADDSVLQRRRDRFLPRPGDVLRHPLYEQSKSRLQRSLAERGYFDAALMTHRVAVTRAAQSATIELKVDTGRRYRFGATTYEGSHIDPDVLERVVPYEAGDVFHQARLVALHERLVELDYFGYVDIQPQPEEGGEAIAPVTVSLTPAKRTIYTAGIGYGTDTGPSLRAGVERRYVNARGHKLGAEVEIGGRRSSFAVLYRMPALHWLPGWWSIGANARDEKFGDFDSRIFEVVGARSVDWEGFRFSGELHVRQESFDDVDVFLVYPEIRAGRTTSDDALYPNRGYRVSVGLAAGSGALGSDLDFARLYGSASFVHRLSPSNRLLLRGEVGHLETDAFARMPPSLRFFAGGDRSIRGYGYHELGERDQDGRTIGGRNLVVASVEIEHMFNPQWGIAGFVDAGNAFNGSDLDPRVGVGVGARWRSPVGPVRVDLGVGLDDPDSAVQLHLNIGPDL
ncbi:MAG TPA: autotransporter assembly complex family protein [Xanthomonadaceae bacterium]|nr:autotransporter assembly complex family protein [Xanthomonadaceae bacterium]